MARFWDDINWQRFVISMWLSYFTPTENLALENEYLCHAREVWNPFLKMRMNKERAGICSVLMNPKPNMTSPWPFMHLSWKRPFCYIPLELKMSIFQFQRSSSLLSVLYDPALAGPHWCCLTVLLICHWLFTVFLANVSERDNSNYVELCVSSGSDCVPCAWCNVSGSKLIKSPGNFRLLC